MPLLLALVLVLFSFPLFAAGTELAPREFGASSYSIHWLRSVASDDGFLTVWQQDEFGGGMALYGSVANGDGQPPAESGRRIAEGQIEWIALVARGSDFLVFYGTAEGRWMVEVAANGTVGKRTALDLPRKFYPVAALSGDRVLLAGYAASGLPYTGYIFDTEGNRLTNAMPLASGWRYPRPVGIRDGFALSWDEETRFMAQFLSRDGEAGPVVELHSDPTSPFAQPIRSAANDGEALVVWRMDWQQPWLYGAASFGPDGSIAARTTFEVDRRYAAAYPIGVVRSGTGYVLLTQDQGGLNAQRLDRRGNSTGATVPLQQPSPGFIDIVSNGRTILGTRGNAIELVGHHIIGTGYDASALTPRSTHLLSRIATRQTDIDIASDGTAFLATWVDRSAGSQTIQTVLVAADGTPRSRVFSYGQSSGILGAPGIASSGQEYLIAWWHGQAIYGVFAGVDGLPMGTPFVIHQGRGTTVDVAWTGSAYIAGWAEAGVLHTAIVTRSRNVSRAQEVSTGITPPAAHGASVIDVDLAWNGEHLLAVLRHETAPITLFPVFVEPTRNILAMRLTASGMQRDAIAKDLGPGWRVSATASGSDFLVAVEEPAQTREVLLRTGDGIEVVRSTPVFLGRPYSADIAPGGVAARHYLDGRHLLVLVRDGFRSEIEIGAIEFMQPPAAATNDFGQTVIVITEFRDGVGPRAVGYAAGELTLRGRRRAM